jgi:ABC-type multidrug transport system fused ATPase/permease subunit
MGIFLTFIGLIYGLMTAFSISNSWEKFSKIRDAISSETGSLKAIYIYSKYLGDRSASNKIRETILNYCAMVPKIEWKDYFNTQETHQLFETLIDTVASIKFENEKDSELFSEMTDELRETVASRSTQLIISQTKIPASQWILNIFLSLIMIIGLAFLSLDNYLLSIFVISSMVASVIFILFVVYEMDSLKIADKEVFIDPYSEVVKLINKDQGTRDV